MSLDGWNWKDAEAYVHLRGSGIELQHGLCRDCIAREYQFVGGQLVRRASQTQTTQQT
jgi:hypothetical protein